MKYNWSYKDYEIRNYISPFEDVDPDNNYELVKWNYNKSSMECTCFTLAILNNNGINFLNDKSLKYIRTKDRTKVFNALMLAESNILNKENNKF